MARNICLHRTFKNSRPATSVSCPVILKQLNNMNSFSLGVNDLIFADSEPCVHWMGQALQRRHRLQLPHRQWRPRQWHQLPVKPQVRPWRLPQCHRGTPHLSRRNDQPHCQLQYLGRQHQQQLLWKPLQRQPSLLCSLRHLFRIVRPSVFSWRSHLHLLQELLSKSQVVVAEDDMVLCFWLQQSALQCVGLFLRDFFKKACYLKMLVCRFPENWVAAMSRASFYAVRVPRPIKLYEYLHVLTIGAVS